VSDAKGSYRELRSSWERSFAFFARLLARVQSRSLAASRDCAMKLLTLEAMSDCAALRARLRAVCKFRSAMPRLSLVCCCASASSSGVN